MKKFIMGLFFVFFCSFAVQAQTVAPVADGDDLINLTQADKQLTQMTAKLNSGKSTKGEISDFLRDLTEMHGRLQKAKFCAFGVLVLFKRLLEFMGRVSEGVAFDRRVG